MRNYRTAAIMLSVLFAVAMPLFAAFKAEQDLSRHAVVRFDIEPYDPRDLLYGRYMTFTVDWNWKEGGLNIENCKGGECCLCVGAGEINPPVSLAMCPPKGETLPACAHTVRGKYHGGDRFVLDKNRYYVDEDVAMPLEKLFRDQREQFSIGLVFRKSGQPLVERLYIGGAPLHDYLAAHGGAVPDSLERPK